MRKAPSTVIVGKRGRSVTVPVTPTAPTITKISGSSFRISWPGRKPVDWAVQTQAEPDGEWDIAKTVTGNSTLVTVTGSPYQARIVGRDAEHNPVTDVSNVIVLNVLVVPTPVLVFSPETNFTTTLAKAGFADVDAIQIYINTGPIEVTSTPDTNPDDWVLAAPATTDNSDGGNWNFNFFENAQVIVRFHSSSRGYSGWSNIAAYR